MVKIIKINTIILLTIICILSVNAGTWSEILGSPTYDSNLICVEGKPQEYNFSGSNFTNIRKISFNTSGCDGSEHEGDICWNSVDKTIDIVTGDTQVIQSGRELGDIGKNLEGSIVYDGQVVYLSGSSGTNAEFKLANADNFSKSAMVGIVTKDCNNNAECPITVFGKVRGVDTSSFSEGDMLYISTSDGNLTNIAPPFPNNIIWVGTVIRSHATEGEIFVNPQINPANGVSLHSLGIVDDLNVTGDVTIAGDLTYPKYYGEMYIYDNAVATSFTSANIYYNITQGITQGLLDGFTYSSGILTVPKTGVYRCGSSISFSGTASNEYHSAIGVNGIRSTKCHNSRVIGTGGDVGNVGVSCLLSLTNGDEITIMVENIDTASDPTIKDANLNCILIK